MEKYYIKRPDGSLEDNNGVVVFFSVERFISDICEGDACFLCGAKKNSKEFNDEHVIPKWILRKCDLYGKSITLPNDEQLNYEKYTVPCCKECNSFLGVNLEEDIQRLFEGGHESICEFVKNEGPWKLFIWLSLIFFKTHLNDSYLKKHLDRRKGDETIGGDYEWGLLHHIHCVIRAIQTGISIDNQCLGTFSILSAKTGDHCGNYDYRDVYGANTMLLRINDVAFCAVLDDSCAAHNFFSSYWEKINGALSPIQLREVLAHLTLLNRKLKYRPSFSTRLDTQTGELTINADLPETPELEEYTSEEFGETLYGMASEMIEAIDHPELTINIDNIKKGHYRFLFDKEGNFDSRSMDLRALDN